MPQQIGPPSGDLSTPTSFREIWGGLRRHRWLILACTALSVAAVTVIIALATPQYESQATLRIITEQPQSSLLSRLPPGLADMAGPSLPGGDDLDTEIGVLRSRRIAAAVVDSFSLQVALVAPAVPREAVLQVVRAPHDAVAGEFELERTGDGRYAVSASRTRAPVQLPASVAAGETFALGGVTLLLNPRGTLPERIRVVISPFYEVVDRFREDLRVQQQEGRSRLVEVSYRHPDPQLAAAVVNSTVDNFVRYRTSASHSDLRHRVQTLREQVATYEVQLREAEEQLRGYRETHRIVAPEEEAIQQVRMLAEVQSGREQALIERQALGSLLNEIAAGGGRSGESPYRRLAAFPSFFSNQGVQTILESLITLEEARSELLLLRTPENAEVRRMDARIAELEQQLHRLAVDYVRSLDSRIASADASLARSGTSLQAVPQRELEFARLFREQQLLNEVYLGLQARLKDAEVQYATAPEQVRVIDPALPGDHPVFPRPLVMLILATVFGTMVGVMAAVAREATDTRLRTQWEVESVTGGIPVVGMIPRMSSPAHPVGWRERLAWRWRSTPLLGRGGSVPTHTPLVTRDEPQHGAAEAFRVLRTSIGVNGGGEIPRVLVITSPLPGDGKSTSSANLAISLAQQGLRVLLIDADLRAGSLHGVLGAHRSPGLAQLLDGTHSLAEALQELDLQGPRPPVLHFVASGSASGNPAEDLSSPAMHRLLEEARAQYDRIIVDTPALQVAADGAVLGGLADSALLVVRSGSTDRGSLFQAVTRLRRLHVPIGGVILNDMSPADSYAGDPTAYAARGTL
jgi:polysaccharide biosynthesis transport protein